MHDTTPRTAGKTPQPVYAITLRSITRPSDMRPPATRLRALVKLMLRGFGFRVVTIREIAPSGEVTP